ncbi:alpha-esterase [Anopheles darlingi]|uniref:Carboxylic ester hydrolase n=1 Tax=Anopheles darlingi TaxID=43151 RepID=W5JER7_ANODA|nr:alpha-esterase [Anopheles darlingi]
MVIHKIYVPPSVVKLPPVVDTTHLPPATAYQPPAGSDFPLIVDDAGAPISVGTLPPLADDIGTLPTSADDAVLELGPGKIVGRKRVLPNGTEYYSYQGIPYAHPPVGELRFKPPVPLEKFAEEPLQCGVERSICLASFYLPASPPGTEDCLYLNVYTTNAPGNVGVPLKPTMLFIHGGGYYTGSGNTDFYGPEVLLQHDVILVTVNYRLGPLGFMALPAAGVYGNQGLKDQQLALKWVHDNIARFGGDPENVTLMGESAGSGSVSWHYLSPKSRQFFHKAICQSGSVFCPWGVQYQPEQKARRLAALLGYTGEDDAGVLETLQNASAEDLVMNASRAFDETDVTTYLLSPFIPSIEDAASEDPIIPQRGEELLKQANTITIPLISGVTSAEGLVFYGTMLPKLTELAGNLTKVLPLDLAIPHDQSTGVAEEVRQFYFQDQPIDETNYPKLLELVGDVAFNFPVYCATVLQSRYQPEAPQYFYRFGYETELNQTRVHFSVPDGLSGAAHADELAYLFSGSQFKVQVERDSAPGQARDLVSRLWTNFAKFGNPTPDDQVATLGFQWGPVAPRTEEPFRLPALDFSNDAVTMIENPFAERIQFWKSLYERYNPTLLA